MSAKNGSLGLNHRQERFCVEYLIDMNATQAALRAGYAKKTAQHHASRLLGNVGVSRRLREALEERNVRVRVKSEWVLKRLGELAACPTPRRSALRSSSRRATHR